jgi:class 3 adenylate cyclase
VLATPQVRAAAADGIAWQDAGAYELRGISEPVRALRAGTPPA